MHWRNTGAATFGNVAIPPFSRTFLERGIVEKILAFELAWCAAFTSAHNRVSGAMPQILHRRTGAQKT